METGEIAYNTVEETYINENDELIHVHVNGETISATPNHPFYVDKFGWTLAKNLRAGDILVLSNDEFVVVEWIQHEILENPIKVYNFEVRDFHTYFVGESSVLVHNDCTLQSIGNGQWQSTEGLIYGSDKNFGNKVNHVLAHATPSQNPNKPIHSVFNVPKKDILGLVDEAWSLRSNVTPVLQKNGNQVFNIPMNKVVGTNSETNIRIVVKNGTSEVITAFPFK